MHWKNNNKEDIKTMKNHAYFLMIMMTTLAAVTLFVLTVAQEVPEAPNEITSVMKRKAVPPRGSGDGGATVEIARLWGDQSGVTTEAGESDGGRSFTKILHKTNFDYPDLPDSFPAVDLGASEEFASFVASTSRETQLDGFVPEHLGITFTPKRAPEKQSVIPDLPENATGVDRGGYVFPPDNRYIFRDTRYPYSTTGRIDTAQGWCTGTMVGRRTVLTASHCIVWNADGTTGWIRFTPAFYNGLAPFGSAYAAITYYWRKNGPRLSDIDTSFDYVAVVLDSYLGDITGYTGFTTYSESWNGGLYWASIGYDQDLGGQQPTYQAPGSIQNTAIYTQSGRVGILEGTFMDMFNGHSGGPFWGYFASETFPRVVGIFSTLPDMPAYTASGDNEGGGGPAMAYLIQYSRDRE